MCAGVCAGECVCCGSCATAGYEFCNVHSLPYSYSSAYDDIPLNRRRPWERVRTLRRVDDARLFFLRELGPRLLRTRLGREDLLRRRAIPLGGIDELLL